MKNLLITTSIMFFTFFVFSAQNVQAQDFGELGLAIKPAIIDVSGRPGETITTEVHLENISASAAGISVGSRSLLPNDPEIDQSKRSDYDASLWISTEQASILLDRGQSKVVAIEINIPESAGPGGHYALVTFRAVNPENDGKQQSNTVANPELTSVVLITVPGLIVEKAAAEIINVPKINFNSPIIIGGHLSNTGNIHLLTSAEITIFDSDQNIVEAIRIPSRLTLPNTIKAINADWDPNGRFGSYTIEAKINFGSPQQTITLTTDQFWVAPPTTSIVLAISLLIFAIFSVSTFKHWERASAKLTGAAVKLGATKQRKTPPKKIDGKHLDELGLDKSLPNTRKLRKAVKPKQQIKKNELVDDFSIGEHKKYIEQIDKSNTEKKK